jgi:uncharacterized protein YjiS (DUF1127 family)
MQYILVTRGIGWGFRVVAVRGSAEFGALNRELKETDMSANIPVLPIAGGTLLRAFASVLAIATHWIKKLLRTRRHWHEARTLASLDRRMLADLGITRADLRDAFSEPFWEDPTALLRERAIERRLNRVVTSPPSEARVVTGFRCRQAI